MDERGFQSPAEIRHRIGPEGTFTLSFVSGSIEVEANDTDEAYVKAKWEHGGDKHRELPLSVRRTDGALHIEADQRDGWFDFRHHGSMEIRVSVPRLARVDINAVSSDIESHQLHGDQTYKTVSGDIVIDGGGGRVSATTVSGDVQLLAARPVEANLTTTSGDVEADSVMFRPLRIRTVSGDMEVRGGFDVGPQHTVESVSGDLEINAKGGLTVETKKGLDFSKKNKEPQVVGDGGAHLKFRSLSGDLELNGDRPTRGAPSWPSAPTPPAPPAPMATPRPDPQDSLDILRALERGEIDVEEASRRLEGAPRA